MPMHHKGTAGTAGLGRAGTVPRAGGIKKTASQTLKMGKKKAAPIYSSAPIVEAVVGKVKPKPKKVK